ncbi:SCP2 sterol-binding domain-containing protein [Paralcaligenes sp. KSB-10]|uniref:ubiquinone biosynthesis accessory factor UbiJ n=1 Tax=Paralcaligenes sp. KSB-10 TaxID=2901142 RepID=UPI001E601F4C|nr:SCP2 sterol-binding domain-containing protein [Paralcaligenes sp. KSB-10]UHL63951.1 SCP2 sterol-binding domain-containing protein [Paralcaligenes sp. KSB-10]
MAKPLNLSFRQPKIASRMSRMFPSMLPIPSFLTPAAVFARTLNKLLQREEWARERLSRHAGKTLRFVLGRISLSLTLRADGYVEASDPAIVPDVTLTIPADKLSHLPAVLRPGDPTEIAALMHVEGDAGLAHVVSDLARDLRWDVESDLARLFGDVAALRMVSGFKSVSASLQRAGERLAGNVGEYLSEEGELLVGRPSFEERLARLRASQARLDVLEHRVSRLESGVSGTVRRA